MKKLLLVFLAVVTGSTTVMASDEIVFLSYIKSTGQQAFNTGYTHKANTRLILDCSVVQDHSSRWEALFGARLTNFHNNAFCFFSRTDGQDIPCFNRSGNEPRGTGFVYGERISILAEGQTAKWGSKSTGAIAGSVTTTGTADDGKTPMMLFNLNTSSTEGGVQIDTSPSFMTLYECMIYEGEEMIHRFVPAKKNGVVGLYDKMTGSFGGSITNTPFVAGEELSTYYSVSVSSGPGGNASADVSLASKGAWVNITAKPNDGYLLNSIEVKDTQGNVVPGSIRLEAGTEVVYSFQMPASGVYVLVQFKQVSGASEVGDVNGDNITDKNDIKAIIDHIAKKVVYASADVNGDQTVDVADIVAVSTIIKENGGGSGGDDDDENKIWDIPEEQPSFPGGTSAMITWLYNNMRYPQSALDAGVQGRVIVACVIEKDGSRSDIQVLRGIQADLDNEAIRLVQTMPAWTPGYVNGKPVRCRVNIPIMFRIN